MGLAVRKKQRTGQTHLSPSKVTKRIIIHVNRTIAPDKVMMGCAKAAKETRYTSCANKAVTVVKTMFASAKDTLSRDSVKKITPAAAVVMMVNNV